MSSVKEVLLGRTVEIRYEDNKIYKNYDSEHNLISITKEPKFRIAYWHKVDHHEWLHTLSLWSRM